MDNLSFEFNQQLAIDVLVNNMTKITVYYVDKFDRYGLTEVIIPDGITSIGKDAFDECWQITSVTIPDTVTNIGNDAFSCCGGLKNITIGKGITKIGVDTFYGCDRLTNVTFEGKTLDEVKAMKDYPWGIRPEKIHVQVS